MFVAIQQKESFKLSKHHGIFALGFAFLQAFLRDQFHLIVLIITRSYPDSIPFAASVAHLLWYSPADPVWCLIVFYVAFLLGYLVAFLVGFIRAFLVRHLLAVSSRDIEAVLDWNLVTHWVGDLSFLLFLYILTVVIWVVCAGGPVRHPLLVIPSPLPVVLAVLLIACVAFRLCVCIMLSSELIM